MKTAAVNWLYIPKIAVSRAAKNAGTASQSQSNITSVAKALTVAQRFRIVVISGY
jgi:hypothetical protein